MIVIDGVEMVDVREAARLTGRTPETIRRWVWSGRVSATKTGNKLFLPRADIPRADHRADGPSEPATRGGSEAMTMQEWFDMVTRELGARPTPAAERPTAMDLVDEGRLERDEHRWAGHIASR